VLRAGNSMRRGDFVYARELTEFGGLPYAEVSHVALTHGGTAGNVHEPKHDTWISLGAAGDWLPSLYPSRHLTVTLVLIGTIPPGSTDSKNELPALSVVALHILGRHRFHLLPGKLYCPVPLHWAVKLWGWHTPSAVATPCLPPPQSNARTSTMKSAHFTRPPPKTRGGLLPPAFALPFPRPLPQPSSPPPTPSSTSTAFVAQFRLLRRCDPPFAPRRPRLSNLSSPTIPKPNHTNDNHHQALSPPVRTGACSVVHSSSTLHVFLPRRERGAHKTPVHKPHCEAYQLVLAPGAT
jgi:hypothetical protein